MSKQTKYIDIKTRKQYDSVPKGMVVVPNYESLTPKAQNQYVEYLNEKNPYELPELVVQGNSQDLPIIDPTETDQNLKVRDYNKRADRWVNSEFDSGRQFSVYVPTQWLSPSHWIGYGKHLYNGGDWKEGLFHNSGVVTDEFYQEHPILSGIVNIAGDAAVLGFPQVLKANAPAIRTATLKPFRGRLIAKELNKAANEFDGTVGEAYIKSPDTWFRKTELPEVGGIKEQGINVTTTDIDSYNNSHNQFRKFILDNGLEPGSGVNEGYFIMPENIRQSNINTNLILAEGKKPSFSDMLDFGDRRNFLKFESAHGNRSQGAFGTFWRETTAQSGVFPQVILEGRPLPDGTLPMGITRSRFTIKPVNEIPFGQRVGFKTGEMPIEGLRYFIEKPNGRYLYQGEVIPEKRIWMTRQELNKRFK